MANFDIPVTEYMTVSVEALRVGASLPEADARLAGGGFSALPVVDDDGQLRGVVSRTDLLHAAEYTRENVFRLPNRSVEELMMSPAVQVDPESKLSSAARLMLKHRVHRVFVAEAGRLEGVVSTRDLMRAVADKRLKSPISEIASGSIVKVTTEDPATLAVDRLDMSNKHGLVVVQGVFPVGIFDQSCALRSRHLPSRTLVEDVMNPRILILPPTVPLGRAASQALSMNVRRILIEDDRGVTGIVSGLDFARVM